MRDYSKVSGQFWTGKTGRSMRGDMQTQIVAMYLMTSPHANMIGVFHCPIIYIAHETGSPLEGALKGLQNLVEGGFCTYDHDSETVWVHEMAKFQIGSELKATDNRVKDIQKQFEMLPQSLIKQGFQEKYGDVYHLSKEEENVSPSEAPSKPLRSQKQEQEQKQEYTAAPDGFAEFWSAYPKKVGKGEAEKQWKKAKGKDLQAILKAIERARGQDQWQKENGQFIPNPATWISQRRWEDEPEALASSPAGIFAGAL